VSSAFFLYTNGKVELDTVAHTCNPSYSAGRDQEDRGSKLALGKWFARPYLEKKKTSRELVEWLKV
jgi:hypothetical protein